MIVSTTILSKYISDIKTVRRIVNRATHQMGVKTFNRMSENVNGAIGSYTHFDLDEWVEMQEKYIETARKDFAKDAIMLLKVAKRVQSEMK